MFWSLSARRRKSVSPRYEESRSFRYRLSVEPLEDRTLLNSGTLASPFIINPTDSLAETLSTPSQGVFAQVTLAGSGKLTAQVQPGAGLTTRLSLLNSNGSLLVQSDGQQGSPDDLITQSLPAGAYFLEVQGLNGGTGSATLSTSFVPGNLPFTEIPVGPSSDTVGAMTTGDFNGDGHLDLATADYFENSVSVFLGNGDGTFRSAVSYNVGSQPESIAVGDFGNGHLDIVVANHGSGNVSVLLGNGNGTFQSAVGCSVGNYPLALVVGDFGNGHLDIATVDQTFSSGVTLGTVSVALGNGNGTFQNAVTYTVGTLPVALVASDFGNGHLDIATANSNGTVSVLLGNGNGTFQSAASYGVGGSAKTLVAGDFGNGHIDIATANASNTVSVLLGNGNGTFQNATPYSVGSDPEALVAGNFGNGHLDLAALNNNDGTVSVLLSNGDGTFQGATSYTVVAGSRGLVTGNFGNGHLDLATAGGGTASVLLGKGDGTFQDATNYALGSYPDALVAGDFGNGHLDLATANGDGTHIATVSVLLGNGDGTFQSVIANPLKTGTTALVAGDFGNGHLDLVTANSAGTISVLLNGGDGAFQTSSSYAVGGTPAALVVGDLNSDNRLDIASANYDLSSGIGSVSVLLGNGDGTFRSATTYFIANSFLPALVLGDFGNGHLDLATADYYTGMVSVLWGNGDGTFRNATSYPVGFGPHALVAGDFGNGHLDLATADESGNTVSVLLSNGNGSFQNAVSYAVGNSPHAIVEANLGNGHLALVTANSDGTVSLLLGNGNGTFQTASSYGAGSGYLPALAVGDVGNGQTGVITDSYDPFINAGVVSVLLFNANGAFQGRSTYTGVGDGALAVGDFGNGHLDIAVANPTTPGTVSVLLGNGNGTFLNPTTYAVGAFPNAILAGDFGNGRGDLAVAGNTLAVFLGTSTGALIPSNISVSQLATPLLADLTGDGTPDAVVVNQAGTILFRPGLSSVPGTFAPPSAVNPIVPARAAALLSTNQGALIAALDIGTNTVSLYRRNSDNSFTRLSMLPVGNLATRLLAGNLVGDSDGLNDDLAVLNSGDGTVSVFLSDGHGGYLPSSTLNVGLGASELALAPEANGAPDILISNQLTGEVTVLVNNGHGGFTTVSQFRAGSGPYGYDSSSRTVQSEQRTIGLAAGDFSGDGNSDTVTIDAGADSLALLTGQGGGSFLNPVPALLGFTPGFVTAAPLRDTNHDGRIDGADLPDLAVVDATHGTVVIFLNDGHGTLTAQSPLTAGNSPSGLTIRDVNGDGVPDVIIGNPYGDILVLVGNGDGSFRPYQRVESGIPLAAADLDGDHQDDFIFANQAFDHVTVQYSSRPADVVCDAQSPQPALGPGAEQLIDLNGDGIKDLVVANSGSNNVLVFLGNTDGTFQPARSFFAGDGPVGITVAQLNDDNGDGTIDSHDTPDLVIANPGSNDVSVLYGKGTGAGWTLTYGPRLQTGGLGPTSTVVQDVTGPGGVPDGIPDILASNSGSNNLGLIPGVGQGLFNDNGFVAQGTPLGSGTPPPITFTVGSRPGALAAISTPSGPGFAVLDTGGRNLTELTNFSGNNFQSVTIDTGGFNPTALIALDLNQDGFTDLLVANNNTDDLVNPDGSAAGNITLLVGGSGGLTEAEAFTDPEVPNPSAIALSALHGNSEFYATSDGVEKAVPFFFQQPSVPGTPPPGLPPGTTPPTTPPENPEEPGPTPAGVVTHLVPLPESPAGFVSQAETTTAQSFDPLAVKVPAVTANVNSLVLEDVTFNGQETTLTNFELLLTSEGGKGGGDDFLARWSAALAEAESTWRPRLEEGMATAWRMWHDSMQAGEGGGGTLVQGIATMFRLDQLELPNLHWRETGRQMAEIITGSVRTSWEGTALAEMGDRLFAACEGAVAPLVPADPVPVNAQLPAWDGGRDLLHGLEELFRPPAPPRTEAKAVPCLGSADAAGLPIETPISAETTSAALRPALERRRAGWDLFWLTAAGVGLVPALTLMAPGPRPDDSRPRLRRES